jgi:hypothetical protein
MFEAILYPKVTLSGWEITEINYHEQKDSIPKYLRSIIHLKVAYVCKKCRKVQKWRFSFLIPKEKFYLSDLIFDRFQLY